MNETNLLRRARRRGALVMVAGLVLTLSISTTAGAAVWSQARTAKAFMAAITPEFSTAVPSFASVQQAATGLRNLAPHTAGATHALIVKAANASAALASAGVANAPTKTLVSDALKQGKAIGLAAIRLDVYSKLKSLRKRAGAL